MNGPKLPPTIPGALPAELRNNLILLVMHGGKTEAVDLPLMGTVLIGRDEAALVQLADPSASRRHAELIISPEGLTLRDLGSLNGTRVGGARVEGERPLGPGEVLEIGSTSMLLARAPAAPGAPSGPPRVFTSAPMRELERLIDRVAPGNIAVLITGETGAGKEVVAELIHTRSARAASPLVRVNCAAFPEQLLEAELFGFERGAFTGAVNAKPGLFEQADKGTLLLDEIGELPLSMQAKLLRVLEEKAIRRLGSVQPRKVDVRVLACTNRDLHAATESGAFRADLYWRLCGVTVQVPPLRARAGEILELARAFLEGYSAELARPAPALSGEACEALLRYAWPGNVRQLRNLMERAVLLAGFGEITPEHLPELIAAPNPTPEGGVRDELSSLERRRIEEALARTGNNQTRAAQLLGMPRRTFISKLERYGIARPRKGRPPPER